MPENQKPSPKKGASRVLHAFKYSLSGINHAFRNEAAFREEVLLLIPLSIIALVLPFESLIKILLISVHLFILIVELLNSGIEAVVDKASPEFHALAKQAKDMGSAAVLLSFLMLIICWAYAIANHYF